MTFLFWRDLPQNDGICEKFNQIIIKIETKQTNSDSISN